MTDDEKDYAAEKYGKSDEQVDRANNYCEMSEEDRDDFIEEHRDEFKAHMKDKMHDKMTDRKKHHMNYDRLCAMAESDRASEITDVAKLDRINNWCDMTPEEREEYKKKHHDSTKDKVTDKMHDKYGMPHDRMSDVAKDRLHDKLSDKSQRLKMMIMEKYAFRQGSFLSACLLKD